MWKTVKNIVIIILCLIGVYYVSSCLYNKISWGSVEVQSDLDIVDDNAENTTEVALYSQKYDYSVKYIQDFLGEEIELSDYIVVVDISEQTEYIYEKSGNLVDTYRISTGETGTDRIMRESLWRIVSKIDHEVAPLYGARMMMMDRYVGGQWIETNVALHGTNEPEKIGTPFTLGCVYHNNADIIALFDILGIGTYIVAIE